MIFHGIDAETDDLDVAAVEFALQAGHGAKLGGADRREILRMREQNAPAVAEPFVKADRPLRRIRFEIGRDLTELQKPWVASCVAPRAVKIRELHLKYRKLFSYSTILLELASARRLARCGLICLEAGHPPDNEGPFATA